MDARTVFVREFNKLLFLLKINLSMILKNFVFVCEKANVINLLYSRSWLYVLPICNTSN